MIHKYGRSPEEKYRLDKLDKEQSIILHTYFNLICVSTLSSASKSPTFMKLDLLGSL